MLFVPFFSRAFFLISNTKPYYVCIAFGRINSREDLDQYGSSCTTTYNRNQSLDRIVVFEKKIPIYIKFKWIARKCLLFFIFIDRFMPWLQNSLALPKINTYAFLLPCHNCSTYFHIGFNEYESTNQPTNQLIHSEWFSLSFFLSLIHSVFTFSVFFSSLLLYHRWLC